MTAKEISIDVDFRKISILFALALVRSQRIMNKKKGKPITVKELESLLSHYGIKVDVTQNVADLLRSSESEKILKDFHNFLYNLYHDIIE